MMWLENAMRDAMTGHHEKRIELIDCVFCPLKEDDVCLAYQQVLDDKSKKPGWCKYIAFIVGGDNE